ncbi:MAG: hypothetical protein JWO63_184, partial [Frankiales bacterium]|nr:hypothetical protein [Frankiales bacterium]
GDGASYDQASKTWQKLPPSPLSPRSYPASVWTGDSLFIWGGYPADDPTRATDGALYNVATQKWTVLPPVPVRSYQQLLAIRSDKGILLLSIPVFVANQKISETVSADLYDETTNSWRSLPDLKSPAAEPMQFFTAVLAGSAVDLFSQWSITEPIGSAGIGTRSGTTGYTLDLASERWSRNSLAPQNGSTAVPLWTGTELIAPATYPYCGSCPGPVRTGLFSTLINPSNGAQVNLPHGPVDDDYPRLFWGGGALLGYGGRTFTALDLKSGRWSSAAPAPLVPSDSAATVWTGKELLVWGVLYPPSQALNQSPSSQVLGGMQLGP